MSNGDPSDPGSLHNTRNIKNNEYYKAIKAVGEVLQYYDADKEIPTYGFGAKIGDNTISHCFALNGNIFEPECNGIDGVLDAY